VLILKVDPSGNLIWARSYGGSGGDWGRSIQETSDGGFLVIRTRGNQPPYHRKHYLLRTHKQPHHGRCKCINSIFSVTDICPLSSDGELSVPESQTLEGIISVGKGYIRLEVDAEISIYDQGGRLISFIKGSKGTTINLKPGTYFVVVEEGKVIVR
jgi:hypothetical protein